MRGYLALTHEVTEGEVAAPLVLDAANGVGGPKWEALAAALKGAGGGALADAEVRALPF